MKDEEKNYDDYDYDYRFEQSTKKQPEHFNYLKGLVFPKIGKVGEYYNESNIDSFQKQKIIDNEESVVAEQRFYYHNRNSQYIGSTSNANKPKSIQ